MARGGLQHPDMFYLFFSWYVKGKIQPDLSYMIASFRLFLNVLHSQLYTSVVVKNNPFKAIIVDTDGKAVVSN